MAGRWLVVWCLVVCLVAGGCSGGGGVPGGVPGSASASVPASPLGEELLCGGVVPASLLREMSFEVEFYSYNVEAPEGASAGFLECRVFSLPGAVEAVPGSGGVGQVYLGVEYVDPGSSRVGVEEPGASGGGRSSAEEPTGDGREPVVLEGREGQGWSWDQGSRLLWIYPDGRTVEVWVEAVVVADGEVVADERTARVLVAVLDGLVGSVPGLVAQGEVPLTRVPASPG